MKIYYFETTAKNRFETVEAETEEVAIKKLKGHPINCFIKAKYQQEEMDDKLGAPHDELLLEGYEIDRIYLGTNIPSKEKRLKTALHILKNGLKCVVIIKTKRKYWND